MQSYGEDLAYIHDAGFSYFALTAAPGLLRLLRRNGVRDGFVVDLGCGSGRWARELNRAGYQVLGVDQSPAMIRLARKIAPDSLFQVAPLWNVELPRCDTISSMGECLNYFSEANKLRRLFRRVFRALRSGGVFVCDFATTERRPESESRQFWEQGRDWAVMARSTGEDEPDLMRREITSFRKTGKLYRRSTEVHFLRLYAAAAIAADLAACGFQARVLRGYGALRFPRGIAGVLAVKP